MIILDSSVIVAFFRPLETLHENAKNVINSADHCMIPDYVLAESLTIIKIKKGFEAMKNCGYFLVNNEHFTIRTTTSLEFQNTLQFFTEHENNLSFVDTLLVILNQQEQVPVETFDKDLQRELF